MWRRAETNLAIDLDNTLRKSSQDCSVDEIGKLIAARRDRETGNWRHIGVIMSSFKIALEMTEEIINPHSLTYSLWQINLRTTFFLFSFLFFFSSRVKQCRIVYKMKFRPTQAYSPEANKRSPTVLQYIFFIFFCLLYTSPSPRDA